MAAKTWRLHFPGEITQGERTAMRNTWASTRRIAEGCVLIAKNPYERVLLGFGEHAVQVNIAYGRDGIHRSVVQQHLYSLRSILSEGGKLSRLMAQRFNSVEEDDCQGE